MQECPQAMRKDACEAMLYFSHLAVENLKRSILDRPREFSLSFQVLAEQVIFSALTTVASFVVPDTQEVRLNQLDDVSLARGTQIVKSILQLVPALSGVFYRNFAYPDQRHYVANVGVFRQAKNYKSKPRSLLKIVLKTARLATQRWQEKVRVYAPAGKEAQAFKEQSKVYENY